MAAMKTNDCRMKPRTKQKESCKVIVPEKPKWPHIIEASSNTYRSVQWRDGEIEHYKDNKREEKGDPDEMRRWKPPEGDLGSFWFPSPFNRPFGKKKYQARRCGIAIPSCLVRHLNTAYAWRLCFSEFHFNRRQRPRFTFVGLRSHPLERVQTVETTVLTRLATTQYERD